MSAAVQNSASRTAAFGSPWSRADEMLSARRVQTRLLPEHACRRANLECAGLCLPCRDVGGDFYDFIDAAPGRVALVLGDVSGKGVPAALMMATLYACLRSHYALASGDLGRRLESVNRLFLECTAPEHYASLFVGEYDESSGRLTYANCGQTPPFVLRRGLRIERLAPTSTVLGMWDRWACETTETTLAEGDLILAVSDGVTDAADPDGEPYGDQRLLAALTAQRDLRAGVLVRAIADEVRAFCGGDSPDDLTLLAARARRPAGVGRAW